MLTISEPQLREAYGAIMADNRWTWRAKQLGDAYRGLGWNAGLGYQFSHNRSLSGRISLADFEGWFMVVEVNGCSSVVRLGVDARASFADVRSAVAKLFRVETTSPEATAQPPARPHITIAA